MELQTKINVQKFNFEINHNHKLIFTGSCFAENIGNKLLNNKFNASVNPTGINYNPLSLATSIDRAISNTPIKQEELFFSNEVWQHFDFHSRFSHTNKNTTLKKINTAIKKFHENIKEANFLFISFGTSMVYELRENNKIVANCHKQASKNFNHRFVYPEEWLTKWSKILEDIFYLNNKIKIIFTVSPIRYFNSETVTNSFSKSSLFIGISKILDLYQNCYYFPSYEIMIDELRDYRFYANDMIHPSQIAIDYIYEKFLECFFDNNTKKLCEEIDKIIKASNHKPFNHSSKEYKNFCQQNLKKINAILSKFPQLNFEGEIKIFKLGL